VNRRENELAERLNMPLKHLRAVLMRLKSNHFVTEKIFGMRNTQEYSSLSFTLTPHSLSLSLTPFARSNYIRHYSCWLISFNNFFDSVHYRLLAMEEIIKQEVRDDQGTLYFCPETSCAKEYVYTNVVMTNTNT